MSHVVVHMAEPGCGAAPPGKMPRRAQARRGAGSPWQEPRFIRPALHPVHRSCFSVAYCLYAPSARLGGPAHRRSRCDAGSCDGPLGPPHVGRRPRKDATARAEEAARGWQPVARAPLHSTGAASGPPVLLLGRILPVCSLGAPWWAGASPFSRCDAGSCDGPLGPPQATSRGVGRRPRKDATARACARREEAARGEGAPASDEPGCGAAPHAKMWRSG